MMATPPRAGAPVDSAGLAPGGVILVAVWIGLLTGLVEAATFLARTVLFQGLADRSPDLVWMAPLGYAATYAVGAAGLGLAVTITSRRLPPQVAVFLFALPSALGLGFVFGARLHRVALLLIAVGAATALARAAARHPATLVTGARRSTGALLAIVLLMGLGLHGSRAWREWRALSGLPAPAAGAPNVLLIILDTVRASNLSLYGYVRPTTPFLEALGRKGTAFSQAIATAPWTLPSHATMFTGRWPHQLSTDWDRPLDRAHPTLAEVFGSRGYRTAGIMANTGYCSRETGLARGFAHYEDYRITLGQWITNTGLLRIVVNNFRLRRLVGDDEHLNRQSAARIRRAFLRWQQRGPDRPFFAVLNIYDAHGPYLPPAPWDRRFGPGRADRRISPLHRWNWDPAERRDPLSPEVVREEIDAYDGSLAYLDSELGLLFEELERRGVADRTLVIVTADHGEEFGEHGLYDHGNSLYLESVRVPLLIAFPGRVPAGRTVERPVSLRDLAATVINLSGVTGATGIPGWSLARHWTDGATTSAAPEPLILSEVRFAPGNPDWFPVSKGDMIAAVADDTLRYIRNGDGSEELYHFGTDRAEGHNLATTPEAATWLVRFRARVDSLVSDRPTPP